MIYYDGTLLKEHKKNDDGHFEMENGHLGRHESEYKFLKIGVIWILSQTNWNVYLFFARKCVDKEYILGQRCELSRAIRWKRVIDKVKSIGYSSKKDGEPSKSRPAEVVDYTFGMKIP